jgi:phosphoribosylformylglycinamidine synthase
MSQRLYLRRKTAFPLVEVRLLEATENDLVGISDDLGLALSLLEMKRVKTYFQGLERNPTDLELQTIGQTWSEHCYHKTFKSKIRFGDKIINGLFRTYIANSTEKINPQWCYSVFEDNAGIVEFDSGFGIAVKVETHNHPSAIEPFGGAATGVGGVIRDILGVWADPIACTDVLGFGPLDFDYTKLPQGVKHPRYVYLGVVAGIGSYGNNMGIPTVNGAIYFDESYTGNVTVYCGCVGLLPLAKFRKDAKAGDFIVLAGGRTGRDGIHGVTFASKELTKESEQVSRPAVQIANPIEEEKLKRATLQIRDLELGSAITDLGGGGLSSAVGEIAKKFGCGACVELDKVPLKYVGLAPWEIYISESQERMLFIIPSDKIERALQVFGNEDIEATVIGSFTADGTLTLTYEGEKGAEMPISFLFDPPLPTKRAKLRPSSGQEPRFKEPVDLTEVLTRILSSPNISSKESVVRTYDHEVQGNTVLKPLQGEYAGPNDAAVLKPLDDSWKGVVISCGMNPNYGKIDAYWMAASAIDEAIRNNIAVGGRRIGLLDNFTWGNPERPERLGTLVKACEACHDFSIAFNTPFISGKDSLYNESPLGPVTPTLLISALGVMPDVRCAVSIDVKTPGDMIYIVGRSLKELGGSEYYRLNGFLGKSAPKVRAEEARKTFTAVTDAIDLGLVKACHDLSEGGLGVACAEVAFAGGYGFELDLRNVPSKALNRDDFVLFSESNSRFIAEVSPKASAEFEEAMKKSAFSHIGQVVKSPTLTVRGLGGDVVVDVSLDLLRSKWKHPLTGGP